MMIGAGVAADCSSKLHITATGSAHSLKKQIALLAYGKSRLIYGCRCFDIHIQILDILPKTCKIFFLPCHFPGQASPAESCAASFSRNSLGH